MLVPFDSCQDPTPNLGKQHDPVPGLHNSGWVQNPGGEIPAGKSKHDALNSYVVGRFKSDRALCG